MREIKFRGKQIDKGEWVYGYYIKYETRQCCHIGEDILAENEIIHLIARDGFADWNMPRQLEFIKVKHETVGQYTGLKDKNGVEIYEGDIVLASYDSGYTSTLVVEWSEEANGYRYKNKHGEYQYLSRTRLEIISNIHDNPESLKE